MKTGLIAVLALSFTTAFAQQGVHEKSPEELKEVAETARMVAKEILGPHKTNDSWYYLAGKNTDGRVCSVAIYRGVISSKGTSSPALEIDLVSDVTQRLNGASGYFFVNLYGQETTEVLLGSDSTQLLISHSDSHTQNEEYEIRFKGALSGSGFKYIDSMSLETSIDGKKASASCANIRPVAVVNPVMDRKLTRMIRAEYKRIGKGPQRFRVVDSMNCDVKGLNLLHCEILANRTSNGTEMSHIVADVKFVNGNPVAVSNVEWIEGNE